MLIKIAYLQVTFCDKIVVLQWSKNHRKLQKAKKTQNKAKTNLESIRYWIHMNTNVMKDSANIHENKIDA